MTAETTVPARTDGTDSRMEKTHAEDTYVVPPVDIYEGDDELVLLADLPGVETDALEIRVDRGTLTIQARAQHVIRDEPIYREYRLTGFYRQFSMPEDFDSDRAEAVMKNGVLTLKLPRAERARPRRVEVRAS
jgi:HSP20 family molecular chaperone IbpA